MDDFHAALERPGPFLQGPHRDFADEVPPGYVPPGFVPLRLTLEPAGPCVELVQPHAIVGRHSEADVRLALPDVSRRHCRLVFADGHWKIIDLNSLNGVYVNEERMHEATVYDGDRIRVGSFTFAVKVGAAEQSSADANVLHHIADVLPLPENERRAS